jgi:elongation factor 1 alpha-like protein
MYDRSSRQPQISSFLTTEEDIAEENEIEDHHESTKRKLNEIDELKLRSCLDEIRNVIGDTLPEKIIVETILANNFDFNRSLDTLLNKKTAPQTHIGNLCFFLLTFIFRFNLIRLVNLI